LGQKARSVRHDRCRGDEPSAGGLLLGWLLGSCSKLHRLCNGLGQETVHPRVLWVGVDFLTNNPCAALPITERTFRKVESGGFVAWHWSLRCRGTVVDDARGVSAIRPPQTSESPGQA